MPDPSPSTPTLSNRYQLLETIGAGGMAVVYKAWDTHLELFRMRTVRLFFLGIFAYVGVEQGIANWISEFLRSYHQIRPETEGAATVGLFWGMMT